MDLLSGDPRIALQAGSALFLPKISPISVRNFPPKNEMRGIACIDRPPVLYYQGSRLKAERRACTIETAVGGWDALHGTLRLKAERRACTIETTIISNSIKWKVNFG